ncbi:MAG: hypothetical protein KDD13_11485 [Mangrovimonas sp.]|nr:hypothetical protein [Mangrovimonas sp.]MCB0508698.1 hypothetical protein [Bacteroidota bacterium]MCB0540048.1 hypothetical protein [Bacteroidota bacterium]
MAILNYTTQIKAEKTIMEIQQTLVKHGASKIVTDYDGMNPKAVTFCLVLNGNVVGYALPANYSGVLKSMKKDNKVPRRLVTEEQALRVSWRIIKDWVEAQMALVQAELADVAEVFLPYAITKSGNTLYKEIESTGMLMLQSGEGNI